MKPHCLLSKWRVIMSKSNQNMSLREIAIEQVARLKRESHPDGYFTDDGRYYLTREEYCKCCKKPEYQPTRKHKRRLSTHARTIEHVANLYGVDPKVLRKEVEKYHKELGTYSK